HERPRHQAAKAEIPRAERRQHRPRRIPVRAGFLRGGRVRGQAGADGRRAGGRAHPARRPDAAIRPRQHRLRREQHGPLDAVRRGVRQRRTARADPVDLPEPVPSFCVHVRGRPVHPGPLCGAVQKHGPFDPGRNPRLTSLRREMAACRNERMGAMALIKMNFQSKALWKQTNVTVFLPSYSFEDSRAGKEVRYVPGVKFQTLYLLHGGLGDDSDYVTYTNIVRYADEAKLAVVMPCGYNSSYTDAEDGAGYFTYIAEELPEICGAYFPLSNKREDTFVGGLSMGSHGAMKLAIVHPERFAAALMMSGASYRRGGCQRGENGDRTVRFRGENADPHRRLAAGQTGG